MMSDIDQALAACASLSSHRDIKAYKEAIALHRAACDTAFRSGTDIRHLIYARADMIDRVLAAAWQQFISREQDYACLVAVGGYGRGELHPHSDIDLLVLLRRVNDVDEQHDLAGFITFLWDIGLNVGHSVRSIQQCRSLAKTDITIVTNLMESRVICGAEKVFHAMRKRVGPDKIWPDQEFFRAKWAEQSERHEQYTNAEYNLEPNIKSSPGGLRDIQTIGWITKRHFAADDVSMLVPRGVLTEREFKQLSEGQDFLWRVRYGLHMLSDRPEDRLLFDHQRELAKIFGFADDEHSLAVEALMQEYYRWAMKLHTLNDMLIQLFDDAIIRACEAETIMEINPRFRLRNGYIEACNSRVFEKSPSAMIEIFQILARRESIEGVHANTQRMIFQNLHLIDDDFRADRGIQKRFIELLRSKNKLARQLRRMTRYGVLGRYIPAFGTIIGQMQHDLFHVYTVDAHTMELIRFLRRFWYEEESKIFPVAAQIVKQLPKVELLYIAGLFHDIAKGRGGDHSELGAVDAKEFCELFGFSDYDTQLVSWLVKNHLLMSAVAQRQDLQDPAVIHKFATEVHTQEHLDYLYALTVADINATNPTLWNSWRASLMRQLYYETKEALRRGLDRPRERQQAIDSTQEAALAKLASKGISRQQARSIWGESNDDYFLRETADDIVWHAECILNEASGQQSVVAIKDANKLAEDPGGATQIFIYTRSEELIFTAICSALEQLELSVQDARIGTSSNGYTLDTFVVLDEYGTAIGDDIERLDSIKRTLVSVLEDSDGFPEAAKRRTPRQFKLFAIPTEVNIRLDDDQTLTVVEVVTADRPGLLALIGRIFAELDLTLINAKITTLGERVEDVFYLTDQHGQAITDLTLWEEIRSEIRSQLDEAVQSTQ